MTTDRKHCINVGCGRTITQGWLNFDNSPSIWISRFPGLGRLLKILHVLDKHQVEYINFVRENDIKFADVTAHIPLENESCKVVYTSHMFHHLTGAEADGFLREARRVLCNQGLIRIVVPNFQVWLDDYQHKRDADAVIKATGLVTSPPSSLINRLKFAIFGKRGRQWMYDRWSLAKKVKKAGFSSIRILPPGETDIPDPGKLDLNERDGGSLYLEARKEA